MSKSVRFFEQDFQVFNYGGQAVLLRALSKPADPVLLPRIGEFILNAKRQTIKDVVATSVELMLVGNPSGVRAELENLSEHYQTKPPARPRNFRLPVCFTIGTDWEAVLAATKMSQDAYINEISELSFLVAMYGFIPGFLYCAGLPESLRVARKTVPSTTCLAGSVAVAGPYAGIYGLASPAGWHILGRTPVPTTQFPGLPPTPFRIGDIIQFAVIDEKTFESMQPLRPEATRFLQHD